MDNYDLPDVLKEMYREGFAYDLRNEKRSTGGMVSESEAKILMQLIEDTHAKTSLETGVAFGASALAICKAHKNNGGDHKHYGVDPNQFSFYGGVAIASLKKEGLSENFHLLEGPSHTMLPKLIEAGVVLDCAFIDGWHTFDYTLIDFFLIDKMLRPGGFIAFHDMYGPAKQKVLRFILSHRKYIIEKKYKVRGNEGRVRTMKFFVWRLLKYPKLLTSWYHWNYQLFNSSGLIVLRKVENYEPDYDFFKDF